ncbi:MAG: hypothetical protein A2032_02915 [Chloroflexi bacterium RBG_19FT_COMBO_49_13]|nr:MAG: hypothetical protein A2032_02915 [Chloroflexi bacterium RBG_19FT_COMBO_49_13]
MTKLKLRHKVTTLPLNILQRMVLIPVLHRLAWADKATKAKIQKAGVDVIRSNYYSNIPSIEDIENSYEYSSMDPPYLDRVIFDENKLRTVLESLLEYSGEFDPPVDGEEDNCQRFFWKNSQFSYSDAIAYYCFLRMLQPKNIIEIGGGFSTLIAVEAIEKNRTGQIHCIEPYPREFLKSEDKISLHISKAQDIEAGFLNDILKDGDILFIDSTHTVKTGSDCLHIYLRLLPKIRRNIFVHVHDVFLPFGMPKEWLLNRQIFWTEQYLLLAFLIDNPKASLLYSSVFNSKWHSNLMETLMGNKYPAGGGSIWFRYAGNANDNSR